MTEPSSETAPPATAPWWGTAAAATQCEGAAPRSDWAAWEASGRAPRSGDGNGFRTRYADDLALLAEHGIRHHRLTVEWARLEPRPGRWDEDEVAHLHRVLDAADGAGVAVWACLLHGTAPGWFTDDERGWRDDGAVLRWARHVDRVAEAVGDRVAGWLPIHDPELTARLGHLDGTFPPGRHDVDDHRSARAHLLAAEAEAARLLRGGRAPVAVTSRPGQGDVGDDLLVVTAPLEGLEAALEQVADSAPHATVVVVTADPRDDGSPGDGRPVTAERAADGPDPSAPVGAELRARRLRGAVELVAAARAGGLAVVGAFHAPAVDGYEWHLGFGARRGLFDRDRRPRPAARELAATGGERHGSP
ncbi:MAG TPA: family 1 glycosylhydrolase [Acidimicrobiales bacterium]|nr:family 1 glycosylhydrolase [Acidimicrobiales bacterium]